MKRENVSKYCLLFYYWNATLLVSKRYLFKNLDLNQIGYSNSLKLDDALYGGQF